MNLWPHTLGAQLIVVTSAAVLVSNLAVAAWFEMGRERLSESALSERIIERTASTATLLAAIPFRARAQTAAAMSTGYWTFALHTGKATSPAMNAAEEKLAARLRAMLPPEKSRLPVWVRTLVYAPRENDRGHGHRPRGDAIQFTVPIVRGSQLIATFFRPPAPGWPTELVIAVGLAIVTASAAAAYIARRVARPLSALAAAASQAARGETAPPVPEDGPDDVRNAAKAFNAMTERVTRTMDSQRQLLSAVGHDLRTPLTAMRVNLEFVADMDLRARLGANLDELQALTESVFSAARGTGGEAKRNIDLSALVESLCADLDELGAPVIWTRHAPAPIACRPDEIRRAVRNLVENAIAYGRRAEVQIAQSPSDYEILVDDEGPGIAPQDRGRVFEPFVRLEDSRNAETGGTGLGLTLVKAIAQGHGGVVELENRPQGGLRVKLRLPREAANA